MPHGFYCQIQQTTGAHSNKTLLFLLTFAYKIYNVGKLFAIFLKLPTTNLIYLKFYFSPNSLPYLSVIRYGQKQRKRFYIIV